MVYYILYVILFSYFFNTIVTFDKILSKILSYCYVKRNDMYTHIGYTSWISGGFMSGFMSGIIDRVKGDMHYLFKKGTDLTEGEKKRKLRAWSTVIGIVLVIVQLVFTVLTLLKLYKLDILPLKYAIILDVILVIIAIYNFASQFTKTHIIGKILAVLLSGVLLYTFLFTSKVDETLNKISNVKTTTDIVDVVVLKNDKAASIKDAIGYTFGYNSTANSDDNKDAIKRINYDNTAAIKTKEYQVWLDMFDALNSGTDIQAVIINDDSLQMLYEENEDLKDSIKIIGTIKLTRKIELSASDKKVNEEPFIIYISGNDEEGEIKTIGRSDVNVLCVVNPVSRQILLITTPRDAYVYMENLNEGMKGMDKLTHAGMWGIDYSMATLNRLYECNIDYSVKVNFTGCVAVVDALGGVTINSDVDFENGWEAAPETYHFVVGENECNGEQTLAFCRERKAFLDGDYQRGRNQLSALTAVIKKLTSPAILTKYSSILDSVGNMILTSMPTSDITALVKGQLADTREWNVQKFSVGAEPDSLPSLWLGHNASMSKLYTGDVEMAKKLIDKIENGDVFNVDEYYEAEVKNIPNYNSFYKLNGISSNSSSSSSNTTKTTSAVKETQPATTRRSVKSTAATEEEIANTKATEPATVKPTVATEATAAPTQKTTEATAATTTAAAAEAPKAEAGNISDVERTAP